MKRTRYGGASAHVVGTAADSSLSAERVDADRSVLIEAAAARLAALTTHEMTAILAAQLQRDGNEREAEIVQALHRPAVYMELLDILLNRLGDATVIDMLGRRVDARRMKALVLRRPERTRGAPKVHPGSEVAIYTLVQTVMRACNGKEATACKMISECGGIHLGASKGKAPRILETSEAYVLRTAEQLQVPARHPLHSR